MKMRYFLMQLVCCVMDDQRVGRNFAGSAGIPACSNWGTQYGTDCAEKVTVIY